MPETCYLCDEAAAVLCQNCTPIDGMNYFCSDCDARFHKRSDHAGHARNDLPVGELQASSTASATANGGLGYTCRSQSTWMRYCRGLRVGEARGGLCHYAPPHKNICVYYWAFFSKQGPHFHFTQLLLGHFFSWTLWMPISKDFKYHTAHQNTSDFRAISKGFKQSLDGWADRIRECGQFLLVRVDVIR